MCVCVRARACVRERVCVCVCVWVGGVVETESEDLTDTLMMSCVRAKPLVFRHHYLITSSLVLFKLIVMNQICILLNNCVYFSKAISHRQG